MIALQPGYEVLRKLFGKPCPDIVMAAVDECVLAEGTPVEVRRGKALPGQIERIRGTHFGTMDEVVRDLIGGFVSMQGPTTVYRLTNVLLFDGVLYARDAVRHLKPTSGHRFTGPDVQSIPYGSLYESWPGNRWFGNWLCDDTLTYRLAEVTGRPFATQSSHGQKLDYSHRLAITPTEMAFARFDELFVFDDRAHNDDKRQRAAELRRRLIGPEPQRHPGVYLMRGASGERRALTNERQVTDHLAERHGFTVIDPSICRLEDVVRICAGARVVAGVEGSQLVHGLMLMPPEARLLVIQPPTRAVSVLKITTDRQGQDFSFIVGVGNDEGFSVDLDELDRTLDLD